MRRPQQSAAPGFTVVETIIVMAIAGLILLIVLEALPALGRNSRNNQRRQDVQAILETVSHYELNNSGNIPICSSYTTCRGSGGPLVNTKLTYYNDPSITNIKISTPDTGSGSTFGTLPANANNLDTVQVFNAAKCDTTVTGKANPAGAGYNDVVALFSIETGSNSKAPQCQQL